MQGTHLMTTICTVTDALRKNYKIGMVWLQTTTVCAGILRFERLCPEKSGKHCKLCLMVNWKCLDLVGLCAAVACYIFYVLAMKVDPDPLFVPPDDSEVSFPKALPQTGWRQWLVKLVYVVSLEPILIFKVMSFFWPRLFKPFRVFTCVWAALVCLHLSNATAALMKGYVGRARPDTYAVCGHNATGATCNVTKRKVLVNQFLSWPSNHAACSMSGPTYTTLFSQAVFRRPHSLLLVASCVFMVYGVYVGATRIRDYKHHADDVTAGLFLGFAFALVVWEGVRKRVFEVEIVVEEQDDVLLGDDTEVPV